MPSHVDFVGVLFIVWGLLTTLVGVSTLALGVGARRADRLGDARRRRRRFAAGVTAAVFTTLALIAIIWGRRTSSSACRCGGGVRGRGWRR